MNSIGDQTSTFIFVRKSLKSVRRLFEANVDIEVLVLDGDYFLSTLKWLPRQRSPETFSLVLSGLKLRPESWSTWMDFNNAGFAWAPMVEANASYVKVYAIVRSVVIKASGSFVSV